MYFILYILIFIACIIAMELVAWLAHKYIMHGFLWNLHKDHHTKTNHILEQNDWFALIFAIPSFLLLFFGFKNQNYWMISIGAGMTAYGIIYFLVHDILVHQRIKLFRNVKHPYLKALKRAHKIHHKNLKKENTESFGFIFVSKKYYEK